MEDVGGEAANRRRQDKERRQTSHHKYMDLLRKLADREADEIVIELDDLATVGA